MKLIQWLVGAATCAAMVTAAGAAQAQMYWRADLGWSNSRDADIRDKNFPVDGFICGDAACNVPGKIKDVGDSAILSGGVGWRVNPNVRVEGTISYRGWYEADQTMPDNTTIKADVKSWNLMANGYYDFQPLTWGRPYIGAGIGYASNKVSDVRATDPVLLPGIVIGVPGGTKSGFAWALMAGVSSPINPTTTLDIGIRYIDLGKVETDFGTVTANGIPLPLTYSGATGRLKAWELSVGLRF